MDELLLQKQPAFDAAEMRQLLCLCLGYSYFNCNSDFYKETFWAAIWASISVTTSNLTPEAIASKAFDNFQPRRKLFLRYGND